ncbi:zinc-binding alcohol dehydrogenase family protein [Streptomyces sp. NPDC013157]|uniref:quinone oxidoreductase family protein n=1 Tax=Streptomyces sp. NPDC013157 TaxID=3364861 RepID=UPI0036A9A41D
MTAVPRRMLAVPLDAYGGPDVLRPRELPIPRPGPGEVLITAEAVGVGFAQTQMRADTFPAPMWHPTLPLLLGGDVVGTVAELGPGTAGVRVGDRVGAFLMEGAYADHMVARADSLVPVPAELDAAEATVLPGAGPIAVGVLATAGLREGESVLVHAAAGGIGHLAVQLARAAGAGQVLAAASTPAKREFAAGLGADTVIDPTRPDWPDAVREATGGRGADVVLDSIGGDVLLAGVRALAPAGRLVFYGSAGGGTDIPRVSVMDLIALKAVTGFSLSAWRTARPDQYRAGLAELTRRLGDGTLRPAVHARLPLDQAATGHRLIEDRVHRGRVVLVPRPAPAPGRPAPQPALERS